MQHNKYSEAIGLVNAPPELKEKTLRILQTAISKSKRIWVVSGISALAAVVALAIGVSIWLQGDFTSSEFEAMQLNFIPVEADAPQIRLAHTYPLRQQMTLDELPNVLPAAPPTGFSPPESSITAYFIQPSNIPDAIIGEAVYRAKNGGILTVTFTDALALYLPIETTGSHILDTQLGVGYSESDRTYYAAYEKTGFTYLLTSNKLNRQEFTDALVYFVTFNSLSRSIDSM